MHNPLDELLASEEVDQCLRTRTTLIGHDFASGARWASGGLHHGSPRGAQADLGSVNARSLSDQFSTGFFFAAMMPLKDG